MFSIREQILFSDIRISSYIDEIFYFYCIVVRDCLVMDIGELYINDHLLMRIDWLNQGAGMAIRERDVFGMSGSIPHSETALIQEWGRYV